MEASDTTPTPDPQAPQVPKIDGDLTDSEKLTKLLNDQATYRQEVALLRQELADRAGPVATRQVDIPSEEERLAARMEAISNAAYYCPGCGRLSDYPRECVGPDTARPHAPIVVVSTDELRAGDPSQHTPAPAAA